MFRRYLFLFFGLIFLSACGSTTNPYVPYAPLSTSSYAESALVGDLMGTEVAAYDVTPSSSMPSGNFTYNGYAGFSGGAITKYSDLVIISNLTLDANFDSGTYSGTMTDFYSKFTGAMTGSVNMTGNISGNALSGTTAGNLSGNGQTLTTSGTMVGVFGTASSGSGRTGLAGTMTGVDGIGNYQGLFVAIR